MNDIHVAPAAVRYMRAIEEDPATVWGGACLEPLAFAGESLAQQRAECGSHETSHHVVGILRERQLAEKERS